MRQSAKSKWYCVYGQEFFSLVNPGFVWHGTMKVAKWIWIDVCDQLLFGKGRMLVKAWSLLTLGDTTSKQIDQGSFVRWLGETVWFPMSFCSNRIVWEELSEISSRACLRIGNTECFAEFINDENGKIRTVSSMRYRTVGNDAVLTPWRVDLAEYKLLNGQEIPTEVRVVWELPEGDFECIRLEITSAEINYWQAS